jgi:hypothetical protein
MFSCNLIKFHKEASGTHFGMFKLNIVKLRRLKRISQNICSTIPKQDPENISKCSLAT